MTPACDAPIPDDELLDYWIHAVDAAAADRIEEHVFSCDACTARLEAMTALGAGLAALVRRGRVSGVVSRTLLNRLQRDGVRVRLFSLSPGECLPCAAFPGDDLLVIALRAELRGTDMVDLAVIAPDGTAMDEMFNVPVGDEDVEILWATPGDRVRQIPTSRLRLTLRAPAAGGAVLAEYELDHTALPFG